jgi:hypothetical protein
MVGAIWWPAVFHAAFIPSRIGPSGTRVSALGSTGDCPCCWPHPGTCPRPGAGQPDDLGGAFSSTAGMTALASLAVGITLLALLVVNEARAAQPIMPLRLPAAVAGPRLTRPLGGGQVGNGRLLAGGVAVTLIGMAWLSRLSVAVAAAADTAGLDPPRLPAHRVGAALSAGTVMLALALAVVLALVALLDRPAELAARAASV